MPKLLEDRVDALMRKGYPKDQAYAIATDTLKREGKIHKRTGKLTKAGVQRTKERAVEKRRQSRG